MIAMIDHQDFRFENLSIISQLFTQFFMFSIGEIVMQFERQCDTKKQSSQYGQNTYFFIRRSRQIGMRQKI